MVPQSKAQSHVLWSSHKENGSAPLPTSFVYPAYSLQRWNNTKQSLDEFWKHFSWELPRSGIFGIENSDAQSHTWESCISRVVILRESMDTSITDYLQHACIPNSHQNPAFCGFLCLCREICMSVVGARRIGCKEQRTSSVEVVQLESIPLFAICCRLFRHIDDIAVCIIITSVQYLADERSVVFRFQCLPLWRLKEAYDFFVVVVKQRLECAAVVKYRL